MYMTHLKKGLSSGGNSGDIISTMCNKSAGECTIDTHVHVELLRIDMKSGARETLRPEFLCAY
jgi:hypothetical protein